MPSVPTSPAKNTGDTGSFEEQLAELEKLVDQLERGDLTLEQSVDLFERGVHLSNACKAQLSSAESRIQVLLDPEQKGPVRVEELALAVDEGEEDESDDEELGDDEEL
jgi:exodeoxyribonuclease VII small subunit